MTVSPLRGAARRDRLEDAPILTAPQTLTLFRSEAYAIGKKEKPPFLPEEPSSSSEEDDPIPDELLCLICKDIMTDAVVIPCCGNSYCDECKTRPWATRGWGAATVGSAGVTSGSPRTKRLRAVGNAGRECTLRPSPVTCRVARDREEPVQAAPAVPGSVLAADAPRAAACVPVTRCDAR